MRLKRKQGDSETVVRHRRQWPRRLVSLLLAGVIFACGVGVGNGRINLDLHRTQSVATSLPDKLDYSTVNQVYQSLKENYDGQLTEGQLVDGLKHGLAEATKDPYTEYFTAKEAKDFNDELNNSFSGIGAELGEDSNGNLQIIAPITGTPAAQAGLKAQDIIASINGSTTTGISVDDAVTKIRGPAGSKVTLQVVRSKSQALSFTITRQNITVPSVTTKTLDGNIGYIQISTFADDTNDLIQKAADQFAGAHLKGIILDLRNDPGGLLDAAEHVSSLWLQKGQMILQEKRGNIVEDTAYAPDNGELHGIPTVVLINGGSASASEITTGALHDNHDAYVIGEKSYGKGVVQQLINFGDGSQLKVTVASWYRPDGKNINHLGITPDKTVKEPSTATPDNDPQLQAAEAYLNK
ncbi:MAG TPA: S41 family peptidase [Verrucomicrobiae bacterium]|nr:S41 family peptidase [Verrucomicrobiae bacterium]